MDGKMYRGCESLNPECKKAAGRLLKGDTLRIVFTDTGTYGKKPLRAIVEKAPETDGSFYATVFDFNALTVRYHRIMPSEIASCFATLLISKGRLEHNYAREVYKKKGEYVGKTIRLIDMVRGESKTHSSNAATLLAAE